MDARKLAAVAAVLLVAGALAWVVLAPGSTTPATASASPHREPDRAPRALPASGAPASTAPPQPIVPCADHTLSVPLGTELSYDLSVGDETETETARVALALQSTRVVSGERVDSWLARLSFPAVDEPVETRFLRHCSDAQGGEEPWMGVNFVGLSELVFQGWRWPGRLRAGLRFGGELRRRVLDQVVRVQRQHHVTGLESVSTPAGSFQAWRIELSDTSAGVPASEPGVAWVVPHLGLVRLLQPTSMGPMRLELTSRGRT